MSRFSIRISGLRPSSSVLLSCLELSDTKVREREVRALLGLVLRLAGTGLLWPSALPGTSITQILTPARSHSVQLARAGPLWSRALPVMSRFCAEHLNLLVPRRLAEQGSILPSKALRTLNEKSFLEDIVNFGR